MSERMRDDVLVVAEMTAEKVRMELHRARASEAEKDAEIATKDAQIKALADALKHLIRAIENDDDVLGCIEAGEDALRLVGRIP